MSRWANGILFGLLVPVAVRTNPTGLPSVLAGKILTATLCVNTGETIHTGC